MSEVRNCRDIGINLQNVIKRLMANDQLVKLLYYTDKDPLSQTSLTQEQKKSLIFDKRIKITPRLDPQDDAKSTIVVLCSGANHLGSNDQFKEVSIQVEVFVPITQWAIKDSNLRPYAILGEIQESLCGKRIEGLGKMSGGDFTYNFGSDEMTAFKQYFSLTSYD